MNDFTKEELENLHFYTYMYHHNAGINQPESFLDKIQSMIDNYCDHEFELEYTPHNCCTKCGLRR